MDLILYAVPLFFLLIFIELAAEKIRGTDFYRLNDALTSLATGSISRIIGLVKTLVPFTVYVILYENFAVFSFSDSALIWCIAFVAYDFCYYWNHRMGHEVNVLWAAHVVHHSSEEYNLTTALRQTGTGFLSFIFYLPLAIVGFDPLMILSVGALNLIYQFWVHTRHVGKLGWFEWFFVTPSNHRGHHAQNTVYIDKNYGGVFIIWDRLFSSYQEELDEDPPIFGIRSAVQSWNPIWINFQIYNMLLQDAIHTKNWWHKLTIWFRRTGWRPPDVNDKYPISKLEDLNQFEKYDTDVPFYLKIYCLIQYISTTIITLAFTVRAANLGLQEHVIVAGFIVLSCFSIGVLMEHKRYSGVFEWMRLGILLIASLLLPIPAGLALFLGGLSLCSMPLLFVARRSSLLKDIQAI